VIFLITVNKMQAQYMELGHNQLLPQFSHHPLIIQILDSMFSKLLRVISNNKQNNSSLFARDCVAEV